jgi:hypothetical protein
MKIIPKEQVAAPTLQSPRTMFDVATEVETTMLEAALYGLELDKAEVTRDVEKIASLGIDGIIVLSLPASVSVRGIIAASNSLEVPSAAYVEQDKLLDLADDANPRCAAGVRLLPFTENDYGRERIGWYYNRSQKEQVKLFNAESARFCKEHAGFGVEVATVQEVISAFNRHLLQKKEGMQVYGNGWYRTLIKVPGGLASRRLYVDSFVGQLELLWCEDLDAFTRCSLALSAGEIA